MFIYSIIPTALDGNIKIYGELEVQLATKLLFQTKVQDLVCKSVPNILILTSKLIIIDFIPLNTIKSNEHLANVMIFFFCEIC